MSMFYNMKKILIRLRCSFIINKKIRKNIRKVLLEKLDKKFFKSLKWGVSYSVFDGEELLEASIKAIRECVDYVNVVYQLKS